MNRVNELSDQQLLRDFVQSRSDSAFAEIVRRHVDAVYSTDSYGGGTFSRPRVLDRIALPEMIPGMERSKVAIFFR